MNDYINMILMALTSIVGVILALNNVSVYKFYVRDNIIMGSLMLIVYLLLKCTYPDLATIAIYFIPILFIYKESRKIFTSILIEIFTCIIIIIIDNLVSSISYFLFGESYNTGSIRYWITCFAILVMVFFVSRSVGKLFSKYKLFVTENFKSKYFVMIYIMLIITFGIFYFDINWSQYFNPSYTLRTSAIIVLMYGLGMIGVCISLLLVVRKEEKLKYEQAELENLKEYTDNLETMYSEMRKFRHDYINIISSMSAFIQDRDIDGLEEYFNMNIYPLNNKMCNNNYKLGLLKNIQMQEVKGLISAKVIRAQELGIDVVIDIVELIDMIKMDKIDLIRSLGIILDNAIEAAINSSEKKINIGFIKKDNSVIIVVTNTYAEDILPISKMFKQGISTKGKNRGLGLSNLKEILGRYDNISLDTYMESDKFVQEISIYNE